MTEANTERAQFCDQCGAELESGSLFCGQCGAQVPRPNEDASQVAEASAPAGPLKAASGSAPNADAAPGKKLPVAAIIVGACVVVAVIVALIVAFALSGNESDADPEPIPEAPSQAEPAREASADAPFPNAYTTQFAEANQATYPAFTFYYPDGWEVESFVSSNRETATLTKTGSDLSIEFDFGARPSEHASTESVVKVADSDFWPAYVQGTCLVELGPFIVAEVSLSFPSSQGGSAREQEFYAVVPAAAIADHDAMIADAGVPAFDYAGMVSFSCAVPEGGMSLEDRDTVIRILRTFTNGTDEAGYERVVTSWAAVPESQRRGERSIFLQEWLDAKNGAYILPESDSRYCTEAELAGMDLHDLYLARNEIFARHGRLFSNQDLQAYFDEQPWYEGTVAPGDFDEAVFNDYERENAKLMLEVEQSRNSPYLNP